MAGLLADDLPAAQQPTWPDAAALQSAVATLATYPPLVFAGDTMSSKAGWRPPRSARRFVLQGGDCAETFAGASADNIKNRVRRSSRWRPSSPTGVPCPWSGGADGRAVRETALERRRDPRRPHASGLPRRHGQRLRLLGALARADPQRLVRGYHASSATLNLVRAFTAGGFADLRYVHGWNKGFVSNAANARYEKIARDIDKAMKFMAACGADFEAMKTTGSSPPTRRCCWTTSDPWCAPTPAQVSSTAPRRTSSGSGSAPATWPARTSTSSRAFATRSASRSPPAPMSTDLLRMIDALGPTREPGRLTYHHAHGCRPDP